MNQNINIPKNTTKIYLDTYGYYDDSYCYDSCSGVRLLCVVKDNTKVLWSSSLCDDHPDEMEENFQIWREELTEIFNELGFGINEVKRFSENCIYDWEFEKEFK